MVLKSISIVLLTLALQPVFVDAQSPESSSVRKGWFQTVLTTTSGSFLLFGKTVVDNFLLDTETVISGTQHLASMFTLDEVNIKDIQGNNLPVSRVVVVKRPYSALPVENVSRSTDKPVDEPVAAVLPSVSNLLTRIKISGIHLLNIKSTNDTVSDKPKEIVSKVGSTSITNSQIASVVLPVSNIEEHLKSLENRLSILQVNATRRNDASADNVSRVLASSNAGDNPNFTTGTFSSDLTVSGSLTLSGGTTSAASGIDLSEGCFAIDGTCLTTSGSGSGITSLGPTGQGQTGSTLVIASSSNGSDFSITGSGNTLTWNLPTSAVSTRGLLSAADWGNFNNKLSSSSIDTSAELLGLVADGTGSGSLVFATNPTLAGFLATASSTLQNFTFVNATGTQATTTSLFSTTGRFTTVCLTGDTCRTTWPSANTVGSMWATSSNGLAIYPNAATAVVLGGTATTTIGAEVEVIGDLYISGSTTLQALSFINATGSSATTTNFFSTTASSTNLFSTNLNSGLVLLGRSTTTNATTTTIFSTTASSTNLFSTVLTTGFINGQTISAAANFTGTLTATGGLTSLSNLLLSGSSTLLSFTGQNNTTTNATTTTLFSTIASTSNLYIASGPCSGGNALNVVNGKVTCGTVSGVASSTLLGDNNHFTGENTIDNLNSTRSTTTNATTTTIFSTTASSTNLFSTSLNTGNITSGTVNGQTISSAASLTGTLNVTSGLTTLSNLLVTGSSTLQNFTGLNNTTTNATSTTHFSTISSSTNLFSTSLNTGLITSGLINSQTISSAANFTGTLTVTSGLTSLSNLLLSGSSTLLSFTGQNNTTTNATTTTIFSTTSSSTNLFSTVLTTGLINGQTISAAANFTGTLTATAGLTSLSNLLLSGSSTLLSFTGQNNTTTNATTTTLFSTTASSTNLFTSVFNLGGSMTFQNKSTTTIPTLANGWTIATSTATNATPLIAFNNNSSSSTISFFTSTTTGLVTGSGVALPSALKQQIIIGNGRDQASVAIVNGSLCIDNDGWCQASSTAGRLTMLGEQLTGADIAEAYMSEDDLMAGEIVSILGGINVSRADRRGDPSLMGVVSTDPGIVMGLNTNESIGGNKYPIALGGRVPVRVNNENGAIAPGDYLTLSSSPGVATKALKSGVVIGQALEEFNGSGVGKILIFVKNSYYSGISMKNLLGISSADAMPDSKAVLLNLMNTRLDPGSVSNMTTDTLVAGIEIITPKLTSDYVYANKIESPTLDFITDRLNKLESTWQSSGVSQLASAVSDWVGSKISAVLGVFDRVETKTVRVSEGLELIDSQNGEVYCVSIRNGEFDKTAGTCSTETPKSSEEPVQSSELPVIPEVPVVPIITEPETESTSDTVVEAPSVPVEESTSVEAVEAVEEVATPTPTTP
ncbi:hypothetical protein KW790_03405 [Candidatus Parcubacteria bacterium]|nr:hypothetical protein [Candidatus Parcubacteria bacterium]